MYRTIPLILIAILFLPQFAFPTKMKSHWKNPTATASSLEFTKVLILVAIKHDMTRKVAEDKAVRVIEAAGRAKAVPSYTIVSKSEMEDRELVKSRIDGMGFDGVIVIRYATSADKNKYDAEVGNWHRYDYFWGEYSPGWGGLYNALSPEDNKIYIETMLFSLKEQKLIWSGITETKNPKNAAVVTGEIAEETTRYLQKEGLIAQKKK